MSNRRKGKTWIVASVFLALGLILAGIILATGGANQEYWQDVNQKVRVSQGFHAVPVQKETALSAVGISKLYLNIDSFGADVRYSDDAEEISIVYYEDYEGQTVVSTENNTLTVRHKFKFRLFSLDFFSQYKTQIVLPSSLSFTDSTIKVNGSGSTVSGIRLGDIDLISVNGGSLKMPGCSLGTVSKISVNGGSAEISGGSIGALTEIKVNGGSVSLSDCTIDSGLAVKVNGGSANITGCTFKQNSKLTSRINGGSVSVKDAQGVASYEINIDGGSMTVRGLDCTPGQLTYMLDIDGGYAKLNDQRIKSDKASQDQRIIFDIDIDGGSVYLFTA